MFRALTFFLTFALFGLTAGCQKAKPPISVTVRPSLVGFGQVLVVNNKSDLTLERVRIRFRAMKNEKEIEFFAPGEDIPPWGTKEYGWKELSGWVPKSGEVAEVYVADYPTPVGGIVP